MMRSDLLVSNSQNVSRFIYYFHDPLLYGVINNMAMTGCETRE